MRNLILLAIIVWIAPTKLSAQVRGLVIDSASNKPVENAIVGLVQEIGKYDTMYSITNEKGFFVFDFTPATSFSIHVSGIGYKPGKKFRRIYGTEKDIDIGNIRLVNMATILDEIVIHVAPVTIKEDTVEYRADAFKVKANGVIEDLLKKLPGIQVDKDGNIKAQGKSVTRVKVNGKDFFSGDPKMATRELPADIVDKIQIIDDYGDQATVSGIKEGEPEKVMNIQVKKDKNKGMFGRVTAGIGDKDRYQASLNGNYFNNRQQLSVISNFNNTSQSLFSPAGGVNKPGQDAVNNMGSAGLATNGINNGDMQLPQGGSQSDGITTSHSFGTNYRDDWGKKINVYGSYTYNGKGNEGNKILSQQNIFSNGTFVNNQDNHFSNSNESHRMFLNIEYNIDSFNYLKAAPSLTYNTGNNSSNTVFNYYYVNAKTSDGYTNTVANNHSPNFSTTLLFNHKFRKKGRNFSLNFLGGISQNVSTLDARNNTNVYISPAGISSLFLYNSQQNDNNNSGIRLTYTEPLSKVKFLDVALSHNLTQTKNDKSVFTVDPLTGGQLFNSSLSNDYENDFFTNRANVSIRSTEKKYNYTVGISLQPVNLRGLSITKDSAYQPVNRVNVFPVGRFSYNFSRTQSLSLNYRGDAQQPSFTQLQDVMDVSNSQYLTKGNPNLKPSIIHNLSVYYNNFNVTTGEVVFTNLSFTTIQNQIVNNTVRMGTSGAQLTTPQNVNGFYNISGFYNFFKPFQNRKIIVTLNGVVTYNHNVNVVDSIKNTGRNWIAGQGVTVEINHRDWLQFAVGVNYNVDAIAYSNAGMGTLLQNNQFSSWILNSRLDIDLPKNWILKYDFEYTINQGLSGPIAKNPMLVNASLEKQIFNGKKGILRLQAFDLLNQGINISRSVNANSIIDSRSNRLSRYFMLTFTYRFQHFSGKGGSVKNPG